MTASLILSFFLVFLPLVSGHVNKYINHKIDFFVIIINNININVEGFLTTMDPSNIATIHVLPIFVSWHDRKVLVDWLVHNMRFEYGRELSLLAIVHATPNRIETTDYRKM